MNAPVLIRASRSDPRRDDTDAVLAALRQGLGAEDVRVHCGVPETHYRAVVAELVRSGRLRAVLRGQA